MAVTAAIISGIAGLGSAAISTMGRSNAQQNTQEGLHEAQLQDARNNEAFQKALAVMINQRSVAGSQDSFGSTLRYDPATNQWVSQLGPLPQAEQTAAMQAAISRNTTDLRNAQFANEQAMKRAAAAGPAYDSALRALTQFRPQTAGELGSLLTGQTVTANNAVMRPIIADTLRNFTRTGTGTGQVLSDLGRQSYANLRDALVSGRIGALQNTAQVNAQNRAGLESGATTAAGLANPTLQSSGIQPSSANSTMATLLADRAKTASTAPYLSMYGLNQATGIAANATDALSKNLVDPNFRLNQGVSGLNSISDIFKDPKTASALSSLFGSGGSSSSLGNMISGTGSYYRPDTGSSSFNTTISNPSYQNWVPQSSQDYNF